MKNALVTLFISVALFSPFSRADVTAIDPYTETPEFVEELKAHFIRGVEGQIDRMKQLPPLSTELCAAKNARLWKSGTISIVLFYGYLNNHKTTLILDPMMGRAMSEMLMRKCTTPSEAACGFKLIGKPAKSGSTEAIPSILKKQVKRAGTKSEIVVRIFSSALTERAAGNTGPGQDLKSENVWREFQKSLGTTSVVIYDGHGRYGAGPGFDTLEKPLKEDGKTIDRTRFDRFKTALTGVSQKPELIMLAACNSLQNYSRDLKKISPATTLLTTADDVQAPAAGMQTVFTVIDSVLAGRCETDLKAALELVPDRADGYGPNGQITIENF